MPDRTIPPPIYRISQLQLPEPERIILDNGIPVFVINMGTQDVLKLELIFAAGRPVEHKKLVARATVSLLKEGTRYRDSAAIAEHFDFYGSSLNLPFSLDTSNLVVYSLVKHFEKVLPVLAEILEAPAFPSSELQAFVRRNKQRLQVELAKPDVVAYRRITEHIFGENHPYGYNSFPETYEELEREDLIKHYRRYFTAGNCTIILSGKINREILELLNRYLGAVIPPGVAPQVNLSAIDRQPDKEWIDHSETVQTAIRIGCRRFNRRHPDFGAMYMLNTVLGGYFGSRLMANIREEKGFTYNIYSTLDTMLHDGFFMVATEVGNEFVEQTLEEIYREMRILQEELVDTEELEMVRNYLLGSFLTMLDGPFNISELLKSLHSEGQEASSFGELVGYIERVRPEEIREIARKYLNPEDMWEVVVGRSR